MGNENIVLAPCPPGTLRVPHYAASYSPPLDAEPTTQVDPFTLPYPTPHISKTQQEYSFDFCARSGFKAVQAVKQWHGRFGFISDTPAINQCTDGSIPVGPVVPQVSRHCSPKYRHIRRYARVTRSTEQAQDVSFINHVNYTGYEGAGCCGASAPDPLPNGWEVSNLVGTLSYVATIDSQYTVGQTTGITTMDSHVYTDTSTYTGGTGWTENNRGDTPLISELPGFGAGHLIWQNNGGPSDYQTYFIPIGIGDGCPIQSITDLEVLARLDASNGRWGRRDIIGFWCETAAEFNARLAANSTMSGTLTGGAGLTVSDTKIQLGVTSDRTFNYGGNCYARTRWTVEVTIELTAAYTLETCYGEVVDLLSHWKLNDDKQLPWSTSTYYSIAPLVAYNELDAEADWNPPLYTSFTAPTPPDPDYHDGSIVGAPYPFQSDGGVVASGLFDFNNCTCEYDFPNCDNYGSGIWASCPPWATHFTSLCTGRNIPHGAFVTKNGLKMPTMTNALYAQKWAEVKLPFPALTDENGSTTEVSQGYFVVRDFRYNFNPTGEWQRVRDENSAFSEGAYLTWNCSTSQPLTNPPGNDGVEPYLYPNNRIYQEMICTQYKMAATLCGRPAIFLTPNGDGYAGGLLVPFPTSSSDLDFDSQYASLWQMDVQQIALNPQHPYYVSGSETKPNFIECRYCFGQNGSDTTHGVSDDFPLVDTNLLYPFSTWGIYSSPDYGMNLQAFQYFMEVPL